MKFDTKIKIALRDDLEMWQKLNVTAFLMSGISGTQDIMGQPYVDKDMNEYLPMAVQPVMIHTASGTELGELLKKAMNKDVVITIYTEDLFTTYNDDDNRASVAKYGQEELNLVGVGIRGKKNHVDKLFKGYELHK